MPGPDKIEAACGKCGRTMQLPPAAVAKNPRCMYCGGTLDLDDSAKGAVDSAAQVQKEEQTDKRPKRVACPICGRTLVLKGAKAGSLQVCMYCSCSFAMPEEGESPFPGIEGTAFAGELPEDAAARFEKGASEIGLDALFSELEGWGERKPAIRLALDAMRWRLLHGHAELKEAQGVAAVLRDVLRCPVPAGSEEWTCPLPPAWTGDLINGWVRGKRECGIRHLEGGACEVRVVSGQHRERAGTGRLDDGEIGGTLATIAVGVAVAAATEGEYGVVPGEDSEEAKEFVVQHILCVDLRPVEGGSSFSFRHEWSTGDAQDLEQEQLDLIWELRTGLAALVEVYACLKAAFGYWLTAECLRCLRPESFDAWLKRLHPDLVERRELHSALEQAKAWSAGKQAAG